ncbi:MAG: hypothetical protein M3N18_13170 [Actinomycetota bacterium]|nr:hypothetical protein [Actinomycetota bacterium]
MNNKRPRILKELRGVTVRFGGKEHSGWLPLGEARPLPTPVEVAVVDFYISEAPGGYLFEWHSRNTKHRGDTWHETLESALEQAKLWFGIDPGEWKSLAPTEAEDL